MGCQQNAFRVSAEQRYPILLGLKAVKKWFLCTQVRADDRRSPCRREMRDFILCIGFLLFRLSATISGSLFSYAVDQTWTATRKRIDGETQSAIISSGFHDLDSLPQSPAN